MVIIISVRLESVRVAKNVLIIGTYYREGIDSASWSQELPYLPDYDTVILDTSKLFTYWALAGRLDQRGDQEYFLSNVNPEDERIRFNLDLVKTKLVEMLEFQVDVFALYAPELVITCRLPPEYPVDGSSSACGVFVRTNDWCPISIDTVVEKGKRIVIKDKSYEKYFKSFKGWEYYLELESLDVAELQAHYERVYKVLLKALPIATNSIEKALALKFTPCFHAWRDERISLPPSERGWYSEPEKVGGNLVLLPIADKYHTELLIEAILERGEQFEEAPRPDWVDKIEVPGEASIKQKISAEKRKIQVVEARIAKLEGSLRELDRYKALLYAGGLELQEICQSVLERLGANTKPSPVSDEFMIEVNGNEALVEVKGSIRNIDKDDIGQLITDLGQLIVHRDRPEPVKAILIGNAWRREPPSYRGTKDKPLFTREVVRIAESQNIGLLPTIELYRAFCKVLDQPGCAREVLDKLINSRGIILF